MDRPDVRNHSVRNRWLFLGLLVILICLLVGLYFWSLSGQVDQTILQLLPVSLHSLLKANYAKDPMANSIPPMQMSLVGNALSDSGGATDVAGRLDALINSLKTPVPLITLPGVTSAPTQVFVGTGTPASAFRTATIGGPGSTPPSPTALIPSQTAASQAASPTWTEIPHSLTFTPPVIVYTKTYTAIPTQKPRLSATPVPPTSTNPPNTPTATSLPPTPTLPIPTLTPAATQPPYLPPPTQPAPTLIYP